MDRTERIAALNDQLRRDHNRGKVVITRGVQALGHQAILDMLAAVAAFSDFTPDNDPYAASGWLGASCRDAGRCPASGPATP